jgi:phosphate transport system substrate-binding protein
MAVELDYVPLPNQVKGLVRATWQNEVQDKSGHPLLKKPS